MMTSREEDVDDPSTIDRDGSKTAVRMHRMLLYLRPRYADYEYYGQLEALDLVNCIIAPVFFANTLALWTRGLLSPIYCLVLLIKGYQMALLLLPNARSTGAHKHARYWLILSERVLRQFLATPLLGRGPRFIEWLHRQAADASRTMFCLRLLLLMSGFTISFWNAFCLPLDFTSQLAITTVFWMIHFPPNVTQIAFAFQHIQQRVRSLLLLQLGIERAVGRLLLLLQPLLALAPAVVQQLLLAGDGSDGGAAGGSKGRLLVYCERGVVGTGSSSSTSSSSSSSGGGGVGVTTVGLSSAFGHSAAMAASTAAAAAGCVDPAEALAVPPGRAPDVSSLAGRAILAFSSAYMLFAVLLLPMYITWHVERALKSKWMATLPEDWLPQQQQHQERQQQRQQQQQSPPSAPGWSEATSLSAAGASAGVSADTAAAAGASAGAAAGAAGAAAAGGGVDRGRQPKQALQKSDSGGSSSSSYANDRSNCRGAEMRSPQAVQASHRPPTRSSSGSSRRSGQAWQWLQQQWHTLVTHWLVLVGRLRHVAGLSAQDPGNFVYPPTVFEVVPSYAAFAKDMAVMLLVAVLFGECFVLLCSLVPPVAGVLWQQIVFL